MRTPLDSPFSPGSDTVPKVWAGRTSQLNDWRDVLRPGRLAGIHERGRTILGEAGSGKSSLVRRIAREATEAGDWGDAAASHPIRHGPIKRVASALLDLSSTAGLSSAREKRIGDLLRRVETVAARVIFALRARARRTRALHRPHRTPHRDRARGDAAPERHGHAPHRRGAEHRRRACALTAASSPSATPWPTKRRSLSRVGRKSTSPCP